MYLYRGREGMWAWLLHRVTGLGVVLFLFVHVADTALIGLGAEVYNEVMGIYRVPFFRVMEVLLAAAVLYHGLNGLRVIAVDFWEGATKVQRELFYAVVVVFFVVMIPVAYMMLRPVFFE
jgi:succinate dehydrogenase / fumarate reductase cytochrome b subunit